jgi:hypothetical protein
MRLTGSAVTETEAAHHDFGCRPNFAGQSAAYCSLATIERSLIKSNQRSYPNDHIIMTSICKTLLALINIARSSWLDIRYNILPCHKSVARNAESGRSGASRQRRSNRPDIKDIQPWPRGGPTICLRISRP